METTLLLSIASHDFINMHRQAASKMRWISHKMSNNWLEILSPKQLGDRKFHNGIAKREGVNIMTTTITKIISLVRTTFFLAGA